MVASMLKLRSLLGKVIAFNQHLISGAVMVVAWQANFIK